MEKIVKSERKISRYFAFSKKSTFVGGQHIVQSTRSEISAAYKIFISQKFVADDFNI